MCGGHEMRRGRHYATFTLRTLGQFGGAAFVGVVGAGFDSASGRAAHESPQGWVLATGSGNLWHAGRTIEWEGQPQRETKLKEGDMVVRLPPSAPALRLRDSRRCVRRRACCSTSTRPP